MSEPEARSALEVVDAMAESLNDCVAAVGVQHAENRVQIGFDVGNVLQFVATKGSEFFADRGQWEGS